jgi:hypothetical protein
MKTDVMNLPEALNILTEFLSGLTHTGRRGFEGLTAALLESATKQKFRISGSGPQAGQDARSEPGIGNRVKVEPKHYRKTALDLRELSAELVQATALGPEVDLWVLVASCPADRSTRRCARGNCRQAECRSSFPGLG